MDRTDRVDKMMETIIDTLGEKAALNAILKALNYDVKENIANYICRQYEISVTDEQDDAEDADNE